MCWASSFGYRKCDRKQRTNSFCKYRSGSGEGQGKQVSQHRAAPVLFGVENYRKEQGHNSVSMTLILLSESSTFCCSSSGIFTLTAQVCPQGILLVPHRHTSQDLPASTWTGNSSHRCLPQHQLKIIMK